MRAVITTPHQHCEHHAAVLEHACDTVSEYAARGLLHHLQQAGIFSVWVQGDTNRRKLDLNRAESSHASFHAKAQRHLLEAQGRGLLLDVHSYPGKRLRGSDIEHWSEQELILCGYPGLNLETSHAIAQLLRSKGVLVDVETPGRVPAILLYHTVQHHGPRAQLALMLEFDEDRGLSRMNELVRLVAQAVLAYTGAGAIGRP